ncbi:DEAD/DEAH box helicase [Glycomyces arizonensis]|uniref:DEAD/DEAH box helicase n=1 Tax=Glycomyces arizonensis TaxID=256035 RepID=UPI000408FCB4|nr:DEAD/DEAH box helicase [Glycomyces arizonensis]
MSLIDYLPGTDRPEPDDVYTAFATWAADEGIDLYDHQEEALLAICSGANVIVNTPTGSGKSLIAAAAHFNALANQRTSFYTAPIKALVSEKFFELCAQFGTDNVGMLTGDASVNPDAPLICCTAEILANLALREGPGLDCDSVVADEFHFYSEPDRGWAWQVPLLELTRAQFTLMSATLGDTTFFEADLTRRTGRETALVAGATRPVPLDYEYRKTPLHETVENLVNHDRAPAYIVHFTQAAALETAQALASLKLADKDAKAAIGAALGGFRFTTKFGQTLARLVRSGIGVHHAGMLPKYRRLVERLAQQGLLTVICGTDTLGVGINVPIRTVVFTGLAKYDGRRTRRLRAREFHQIAGRAGRAGFDTEGFVVCQAPEHVIENTKAEAKFGLDPKKRKKMAKKKPPEGFVGWTEETFTNLAEAEPEPLTSRMRMSHAMLVNMLARPGGAFDHVRHLIEDSHADRPAQLRMARTALTIARTLRDAGIIVIDGKDVQLTVDLPDHFALNQPLAPFALAALDLLDPESEDYPMEVVSVVEATLEGPGQILAAQRNKAKGEAIEAMKADGVDYFDRMNRLDDDEIDYPKPLAELLEEAFDVYKTSHPWAADYQLEPKSILREIWEQHMSFGEYIGVYSLPRAEGLLLRYLSSAYKALIQTLPEGAGGPELDDLTTWLGETIRQTDSSLINEWEQLTAPADDEGPIDVGRPARAFTDNERAFTIAVRNQVFRHVELAATDRPAALAALETGWPESQWDAALERYFASHDDIGTTTKARSDEFLDIEREGRTWRVRQTIDDPAGDRDWAMVFTVDLDASDEAGTVVATVEDFTD